MSTITEVTTAPRSADIVYPTSDGRPMGETDLHRTIMIESIESLQLHYAGQQVYVSGNILLYYQQPALQGYRLRAGRYGRIKPVASRLPSRELGLHLQQHERHLRFFDPATGHWIPTLQESRDSALAESQQAETRRQQAETRRQQAEAARREMEAKWQVAEAEAEGLRRELERLRRQSGR